MSADSVATAGRRTVAAGTLEKLSEASRTVGGPALRSSWERVVHVIGQALLSLPASTWLLLDISILATGIYLGYRLFPPPQMLATPHIVLWQAAAVFAFVVTMASLVFGLYDRDTLMSRSRILTRMLLTSGTATVAAYAIIYVIMYATISRRVAGVAIGVFLFSGVGIRLCACWAIHKVHRGLLVVGGSALFESFERAQEINLLPEYRLVGYVTPDRRSDETGGAAYLGTLGDQLPRLGQLRVTDIVVGAEAAGDPWVMDWVVPCLQRGCRVTNEAIFYEKATGQILVDEITPLWFLFADLKAHCDEHATLKRVFDLIAALVGICLSTPLLPLIALAIKLDSRGKVFYSHQRVGQNGKAFKLYKFRTMHPNAENGKSVWSVPNDPRVTRVGRFLRRCRLDELPQFYNVLIGNMSIIGPRPERPDIVRKLSKELPYYAERHLVKPGITGWAQISFRYGSSIEDAKRKLQFDLYYLKHMCFELDLVILFRTVGTFLRGAC